MSEITSNEKLERLEQRHMQLLDGLDSLNQRLEETLISFAKPSAEEVVS